MMHSYRIRLLYAICVSCLFAGTASSQTLFWNRAPLTGDWGDAAWATTSGGSPLTTWTSGNNATFDQTGTYTVTASAPQTVGTLSVAAGNVTLSGSLISSNAINVSSGATLSSASNTLLRGTGTAALTTSLTVNGTLNLSGSTSGQRVTLSGSGAIVGSSAAQLRTGGAVNFSGNLSGSLSLFTEAGGTITLGGNNTYVGNSLFRNGNTIRLNSVNALPTGSLIRFGGGTNIVELAAANFSRTIGDANGNVRFHTSVEGAGNSGFAAIGADRTVAINGSVVWSAAGDPTTTTFMPGAFHLGNGNSTHTVTLTTGIDFGGGTRTINVENGSAAVGGRISGNLSNGTLNKTGAGTLALSGANSFGSTLTFGVAGANLGAIRLESNTALGGVTVIAGNNGTGTAQARIELANNVTISGIEYRAGGRSNPQTTGAAIVNVSGDNEWAGTVRITNTGGSYGIRSDSGRLTISGSLQNTIGTARTWDIGGAGDVVIAGSVVNGGAGTLALNKFGPGTLTLTSNANTYSGGTTLNGTTLLVNNTSGSGLGTGPVTINSGTLGGTGAFTGNVTVNATGVLSPGASIESLGTGAVTFNNGSSFLYELDTSLVQADLLNANGNLSFDGIVNLNLVDLGSAVLLPLGSKFTLISYSGTWDGDTFTNFADDSTFSFSNNHWLINYNDTTAGSLNGGAFANGVTLTAVAVPEPSTLLVLAGCSAWFGWKRRRNRMRSLVTKL